MCKFPACLIQANLWCFSVFPVGVVCTGAVLHSSPLLSSCPCKWHGHSHSAPVWAGGYPVHLWWAWWDHTATCGPVSRTSSSPHSLWLTAVLFKTLSLITWSSALQNIWTLCQCTTRTFCWTWWMNGLRICRSSLCPITSPAWMTLTSGVGGVG